MKFKKVLFLMLFPLITQSVVSCCSCMEETIIGYYTNKTILVDNLDNSGSERLITTGSFVPKEAYGIRIQLNREKTVCLSPSKPLFIQTAYATKCDCLPPNQLFAKDSITAINIITLNDFDMVHPANSDVSDYFKSFDGSSFNTINYFIEQSNTNLQSESDLELTFDVLLMTPPSLNQRHFFKIRITLSDGRILEGTTKPIDLI